MSMRADVLAALDEHPDLAPVDVDWRSRPQALQEPNTLLDEMAAAAAVDPEHVEFGGAVPASHDRRGPPCGHNVQDREFLGKAQRIVERGEENRADLALCGPSGRRSSSRSR